MELYRGCVGDEPYQAYFEAVDTELRRDLPATFRGYSTSKPSEGWVRRLEEGAADEIDRLVHFYTPEGFDQRKLGTGLSATILP